MLTGGQLTNTVSFTSTAKIYGKIILLPAQKTSVILFGKENSKGRD